MASGWGLGWVEWGGGLPEEVLTKAIRTRGSEKFWVVWGTVPGVGILCHESAVAPGNGNLDPLHSSFWMPTHSDFGYPSNLFGLQRGNFEINFGQLKFGPLFCQKKMVIEIFGPIGGSLKLSLFGRSKTIDSVISAPNPKVKLCLELGIVFPSSFNGFTLLTHFWLDRQILLHRIESTPNPVPSGSCEPLDRIRDPTSLSASSEFYERWRAFETLLFHG